MLHAYAGPDALTGKKIWKARTFRGTKREADRALAAFLTVLSSVTSCVRCARPRRSRSSGQLGATSDDRP